MNYLAHVFLSGANEELLVGNFIADSVKGNQRHLFSPGINQGIALHRQIDTFTDSHSIVEASKKRLRPDYRKYAGVITDIFYDHFLAIHFNKYTTVSLPEFSQQVYKTVLQHEAILPEKVHYFLPYMMRDNWLLNYQNLEGIKRSLTGMSRRTTFISNMETATVELEKNYAFYETEFLTFFPELQEYVHHQIEILSQNKLF